MRESENLIGKTLEEFFSEGSISEVIRNLGANRMVPLEVSIEEILEVAKNKGFYLGGFREENEGIFWVQPKEGSKALVMPTRQNTDGRETAWLFDNDVDYFMDLFLR